jgi:hypothetical protein
MARKKFKIWITKYAFTRGLVTEEAEETEYSGMVLVRRSDNSRDYFHKPYWHHTKKEALAHVKVLGTRKIEAHKRAIKKIEDTIAKIK